MNSVLKVYRAERYSPNSVDKDRDILDAVGGLLARQGCSVSGTGEDSLAGGCKADIILSMARSSHALAVLKAKEKEGCAVINRPDSVLACKRSNIDLLMRTNGLPAAPMEGVDGYWIKRGDEAAQSDGDVVYASNEADKDDAVRRFHRKGVGDIVVTAHVKGDLVKFYGVSGTGFFRIFYPGDDGIYKFADELVNGTPRHFRFSVDNLMQAAERLARLTGVCVYGGDCIVRADGTYAIIDFNDWPSFSRCKEEAAEAIVVKVKELMSAIRLS